MGDSMLAKCANPFCASSFRYLSKGKLFLADPLRLNVVRSRECAYNLAASKREWFWLCERCCSTTTLAIGPYGNAGTVGLLRGSDGRDKTLASLSCVAECQSSPAVK